VPESSVNNELLAGKVKESWEKYDKAINDFDLKKALEVTSFLADVANKYVEDTKPWVLAKEDDEKLKNVMYDLSEMLRHIGLQLLPFLPDAAGKILEYLGEKDPDLIKSSDWGLIEAGREVVKPEPLFKRIEESSED